MKSLKKLFLTAIPLLIAAVALPAAADAPAPNFIERNSDWLPFLLIGVLAIAVAILIVCIVRSRKTK